MKLKTSLFDRTIFKNMLQRYWLIFAGYLCVMGAVLVIPLVNALQEAGWYPTNLPYYASLLQLMGQISNTILITFAAAPIAATMMFSYLYNARHTGMMASLPIKRETMFLSVSAAALAGFFICNVIIVGLVLLVEAIYGQVHLGALGLILLIITLSSIAFFGMAAFCCMLTGNILAGPAVYCIFNLLTIFMEALVYGLLQEIVFGMSNGFEEKTAIFSPIYKIMNELGFYYDPIYDSSEQWIDYTWHMEGMGVLAAYTVAGLVFLFLGMQLYKHRRMETAGDTISIEILKPIFKLCMTVCGGLVFAWFMAEMLYQVSPTGTMAAVYLAVLLIIGGTACYFIAQMLITKTVNVFRSGWKSVGLYAICVILVITGIENDMTGYERKVPDAEDVESVYVSLYDGQNIATFEDEENINTVLQLHRNIITNKDFHEWEFGSPEAAAYIGQFDDPAAGFQRQNLALTYTLKDGSTMKRVYCVSYGPDEILNDSSEIRVLEALMNTDQAIADRLIMDFAVTADNIDAFWIDYVEADTYENLHFSDLSPSEMVELYNECILPDIADGNLGVYNIIENKEYALNKYNCIIGFNVYEKCVGNGRSSSYKNYRDIQVYLTLDAERTLAFLKEHGVEPAVIYDSMVAKGYAYNELGRYKADGEEDINYRSTMEVTKESSVGVIGGADGPTEIVVID
ncbi:MAG: hypothetical protein J6J04_00130 [Oscillospiraceae bacterium]|nr:hypothetical protein [Oscillospiraceae bacterium]